MSKIALIHYNIGNLLSVERAFRHMGADLVVAKTPQDLKGSDKIILPGVGAFKTCRDELSALGFDDEIREFVAMQKPLLGICVGMQMLFDLSEEFSENQGFGFIKGRVKAIPNTRARDNSPHKIPHIGWNSLYTPEGVVDDWSGTLLNGVKQGSEMYFVHSFTGHPEREADRLADSYYNGRRLSAMVEHNNVFGTQFHPEKSGDAGLKVLENFIKF